MQSYVTKTGTKRLNTSATSALLKEIGMVLRDAREKKSYTIRDVREVTCIPIHHIIAIESGDRAKLPEDFYLLGFIKRFAKAVDVSDKAIMEMTSRERKYKSPGYESEAFDLLFDGQLEQNEQEHEEQKVVRLRNRKERLKKENSENTFFKVYHFYLLVGMILFVTALHMIFQSIKTNPNELKTASTLVVEDGKPVFVAMSKDKIAMQEEHNAQESDEVIVDEIKENEDVQEEDMVEPAEEVSWGGVDQLNKKQTEIQNNSNTVKETQIVVRSNLKNIPKKQSKPVVQKKQTKLIAKITEVKQISLQRNISLVKNEDRIRLRPLQQQADTEPVKQSDSIRLRPLLITN